MGGRVPSSNWWRARWNRRLHAPDALRNGLEPAPTSERSAVLRGALNTASLHDPPDLFRAYLASRAVLTPLSETFAQDGVAERTLELAGEHERTVIPGPSREDLLTLLG